MLSIFALPKPFVGHTAVIQRNAILSWTHLRPRPHIVLFGDERGTAEVCRELGLQDGGPVERSEGGTPLVSSLFEKAQSAMDGDVGCYVNSDIMLMDDLQRAVGMIPFDRFLMIGRRWDIDISSPWDFSDPGWQQSLRNDLERRGVPASTWHVDYFVFTRGLWGSLPPFSIGRRVWDNHLVYLARAQRAPVVDASGFVTAIHQNHGLDHIAELGVGAPKGPENVTNLSLVEREHLSSLRDADWIMTGPTLRRKRRLVRARVAVERLLSTHPRIDRVVAPVMRFARRAVGVPTK